MSMISSLRSRYSKHAAYRRTLHELEAMSDADMRDLNMARADVRRIAYQAVYGN